MRQTTRGMLLSLLGILASACATIPQSAEEGKITIQDIADSIKCELAAVAVEFPKVDLPRWKALTDLDLTVVTNVGGDAKAKVTAPHFNAVVSVTPSLGLSRKDTSISHVQFVTPIKEAKRVYGETCHGRVDPSETRMGMAEWLRSTLSALNKDTIAGVTFTKEFQIVANAGARFGYVLEPVTNTVDAEAGGSGSYDRTHRFSIAMTPPDDSDPEPKPVYLVRKPKSVQPPIKKDRRFLAQPERDERPVRSQRSRAVSDPTLQYLLQRKSPVKIER